MTKELEALDKLAKQIELDEDADFWEIKNAHKTVEQALLKAEKLEKVLKIIKRKNVLIRGVQEFDFELYNSYTKTFNASINNEFYKQLTQEEFDLLKEMLE